MHKFLVAHCTSAHITTKSVTKTNSKTNTHKLKTRKRNGIKIDNVESAAEITSAESRCRKIEKEWETESNKSEQIQAGYTG